MTGTLSSILPANRPDEWNIASTPHCPSAGLRGHTGRKGPWSTARNCSPAASLKPSIPAERSHWLQSLSSGITLAGHENHLPTPFSFARHRSDIAATTAARGRRPHTRNPISRETAMTYSASTKNTKTDRRVRSERAIVTNSMLREIAKMVGLPRASKQLARQLLYSKPKRVSGKVTRLVEGLKRVRNREDVADRTRSNTDRMIKLITKRSRDKSRQWIEAMVTRRHLRMKRTPHRACSTSGAKHNRRRLAKLAPNHRARVLMAHGGRKVGSHRSPS